ncbi:GNAT family N-acetyltransferase [Planctobacterium marinum]|uniref:GNAT family N-acetyltransferase n=1 Tax=Planctobacterium marinum TaxID=1631968 RepID=UPI001E5F653D|nr:GNAT family N-acetyltransferase [Planctobacterium marinum]MCC2603757.1 GNAT family N-acetyltransferase [Planctobacterium marinum]
MKINTKHNEVFEFRPITTSDQAMLVDFFEGLSPETLSKFGPHPLTSKYCNEALNPNLGKDGVSRYIIASKEKVVGYFIVDFNEYPHERARYNAYQIDLDFRVDPVFAPCIADTYQNQGIAGKAFKALISTLQDSKLRSLVLMGGTQEPNTLARNFYKRHGFQELGEFYTDYNGLNNIDMRLML